MIEHVLYLGLHLVLEPAMGLFELPVYLLERTDFVLETFSFLSPLCIFCNWELQLLFLQQLFW